MKVLTADRDGKLERLVTELLESCRDASDREACDSETILVIITADQAKVGRSTPKLFVPMNRGYRVVTVSDILFAEAGRPRTVIHLAAEELPVDMPLAGLQELLGPRFVRSHNSYLVNIDRVQKIQSSGDRSYEVTFAGSDKAAWTSRSRASEFIGKVELMCQLSTKL